MADLGFLHFYFSCKNYQELAQARITKVVGFFTRKPTKLGLHFSAFSTQFTRFCKAVILFEIHFCTGVPGTFQPFTDMPSVHTQDPGNIPDLAIGSLGPMEAAARRNPAAPVGFLVGGGVEEV
jgi:hypothetical protein